MSSRTRFQIEDKISDHELDLSCEGIVDIPVREMSSFPRATNVDLSNNHIRILPVDFASSLTHITQLDISKNLLQKLPENFGLLTNLRHLDLYSNQIERLPLSMSKLRKLRWLDLKDNPLVPSLKKIVGECWDAEQCYTCSKNVVAFMGQIEAQVGRGGGAVEEVAETSYPKPMLQKNKKGKAPSNGVMSNGNTNNKAKQNNKFPELSSDEEVDTDIMSSSRDDEPVNTKKKRKRNMNKKVTPVFSSDTEPISYESPTGHGMDNVFWLIRSIVWLLLFSALFFLLCSLCISNEGFKGAVKSVSSVDRLNVILSEQHSWIQTELLKTNRLNTAKEFGNDALVLFTNYFYTLVDSVANSVGALTGGAIGK